MKILQGHSVCTLIKKLFCGLMLTGVLGVLGVNALADTFFEMGFLVGERQLDVFRKGAPNAADDAPFIGLSLGAYRVLANNNGQPKAALGGVVEVLKPVNRDAALPGDGLVLGFRPINYWRNWGTLGAVQVASEFYFGAAQYGWIRNTQGFYLGANLRVGLGEQSRYSWLIDYKYFQDLAHDGGPGGDQVVDGPSLSLGLRYRF